MNKSFTQNGDDSTTARTARDRLFGPGTTHRDRRGLARLAIFKIGIEKARDENRITTADANLFLKLGAVLTEGNRKGILSIIFSLFPRASRTAQGESPCKKRMDKTTKVFARKMRNDPLIQT